MHTLQIVIIVLSSIMLVSVALNIWIDYFFWNSWGAFSSYISEVFMIVCGIMLICAVLRNLSYIYYRNALIMLYIADVFALGSVVLFEIAMYGIGVFNWASLISLLMITGLIVVLHIYMKQNPDSAIVIPLNQQPIQY